jgi:predicted small integral membrane protein
MLIARYAKILIALSLALFCLLVAFDNVADPRSNYVFVTHVMSMDTTFHDSKLMYRSVTNPIWWTVCYALIVATQFASGLLLLAGSVAMWRARLASGPAFEHAKRYAMAGCLLAFLLWFFVFMVIAGEWFAMWESQQYNAQQASFRFYVTVLAALIFLHQRDDDLPEQGAADRT